jgi:hypothetical protein
MREQSAEALLDRPTGPLWLIDQAEREAGQLAMMAERFEELRPRVAQLDKLASLQGVDAISTLNDVAPLLFQHNSLSINEGDLRDEYTSTSPKIWRFQWPGSLRIFSGNSGVRAFFSTDIWVEYRLFCPKYAFV